MADGSRRTAVTGRVLFSMTPGSGVSKLEPMPPDEPARTPSNHAALLLIRAWREDPSESSLRAQVTEVANLDAPQEVVHRLGTRAELHALLDRWLDRLFDE